MVIRGCGSLRVEHRDALKTTDEHHFASAVLIPVFPRVPRRRHGNGPTTSTKANDLSGAAGAGPTGVLFWWPWVRGWRSLQLRSVEVRSNGKFGGIIAARDRE